MTSLVARTLAVVVLVNAPFWGLGQWMFMNRGVVNVEAVLAAGVVALNAWIGVPLLIVVWMIDAGVGQTLTYHFATPLEFLEAGRFANELEWRYFDWSSLLLVVLFAAGAYGVVTVVGRRPRVFWGCLAIAAVLSILDTLNGSALVSQRENRVYSVNLAGSPSLNLAMAIAFRSTSASSLQHLSENESVLGAVDIPAWASAHPDRGILLVVVESLGAPMDEALRRWLDGHMTAAGYETTTATLPFNGATTRGELRSLCGLAGHYALLTPSEGQVCLPHQLAALGWQSAGFHGFSRNMFDRKTWWPNTGLTESHFIEAEDLFNLPRCGGTFAGACDAAVLRVALDYAERGKRLGYVLTLNTHLPMTRVEVPMDLQGLCARASLTSETCIAMAALGRVLDEIRTQVTSAARPPLVVAGGDHSPPFSQTVNRDAFRQDVVPAYVMRPQ